MRDTCKNSATKRSNICNPFIAAIWNQELILNKSFPQKPKLSDVTLAYKKEDSDKSKKL